MKKHIKILTKSLIHSYYVIKHKFAYKKFPIFQFYDDSEIIDLIVNKGKSLSRFGEGEFRWILNIKQNSFQVQDSKMAIRLKEILQSNNKNIIIGIPIAFNTVNEYSLRAQISWNVFITRYSKSLFSIINNNKKYGNASITRPYMDYKDKKTSNNRFDNLKKIWNDKDVIIIEGNLSRLGVNNDLFDNAKSIKRILCPSVNAFSMYDKILEEVLRQSKNNLFLLALGPTASILSYDMCIKGYQAIDIGHIDVEYEWFKRGVNKKTEIEGKYVNESKDRLISDSEINDDKYAKSIIIDLSKNEGEIE